jgi:hypothetical protein
MNGMTFEVLLGGLHDVEAAQYRFLGHLQEVREAFSRNVIYPYLGELIALHKTLESVIGKFDELRCAAPGRLVGVDLEAHRLIYERTDMGVDRLDDLEQLLVWAVPHVRAAIEEGRTIFEFVDENLRLEEVGIIPSYVEEGYLMIPDRAESRLHIVRYRLSIFSGADERYRTLRTTHVKTIPQGLVASSPTVIKMDLMSENKELPNPATFLLETDLDFPYKETVLPVAKRKLMHKLTFAAGS